MEWQDDAVVLSSRGHGERDAILTALTFEHGRHLGLVRGGAGKRQGAVLQAGNRLVCTWRARLPDQLGQFTVEPARLFTGLWLDDPMRLAAAAAACATLDVCLAERDPHPELFAALVSLLGKIAAADGVWPEAYVRFELVLLAALGFGLDLESCAATGATTGLAFVSPRSGRAVSQAGAGAFAPRLLPLPGFLHADAAAEAVAPPAEISAGLHLAGHFLRRHILDPADREMPLARERLAQLWRQREEQA